MAPKLTNYGTDPFALLSLPCRPAIDLELLEKNFRHLAAKHHPDQATGSTLFFEQLQETANLLRQPATRLRFLAGGATASKTRLLSKLASDDEVPGTRSDGSRSGRLPLGNPQGERAGASESTSGAQNRSVQDVLDGSSTGATQQFAAEVEFRKKSIIPVTATDLFSTIASALGHAEEAIVTYHAASGALAKALLMSKMVARRLELSAAQEALQEWQHSLDQELQSMDLRWPNVNPEELLSLATSFTFVTRWEEQLREELFRLQMLIGP